MARFRVQDSESGSDEDNFSEEEKNPQAMPAAAPSPPEDDYDDDDSEGEDDSEGSYSSDLHEEDLVTRPRPRNALVEDENGEMQYADADAMDPALWPQRVGVDYQKMHVMQASLFRAPEEAAALRASEKSMHARLQVPLTLNRKHSRDSEGDSLRVDPKERASFAHDVEAAPYRPTRKYARVESSRSAVYGNESSVIDAGLAFGRSFRVGWAFDGSLIHPGVICAPWSSVKPNANSSALLRSRPTTCQSSISAKLLQHQLSNTTFDFDDEQVPFAIPSSHGLYFDSFASLFASSDRTFEASLFRLGSALFDPLILRLGESVTPDVRSRVTALRRKTALSAWLQDVVRPTVDADLRNAPSLGPAGVAFVHLTGNQVEQACDVALDGGLPKLATLIAQAGGDFSFREDLREQLDLWREQRVDLHVEESVRKIYALLAGLTDTVVEGSKGGGQDKCADVDILTGLDWKRIFGLHLWYSEPVDATISQVFAAYSALVKDSTRKVASPIPRYEGVSRWNAPSVFDHDAFFSLIRVHAEPTCSLSQVLTPLSFGPSPVDFSLTWHLYILLSRCMRVRDLSDRGDPGIRPADDGPLAEGHSPSADLLSTSYAFQLEQLGMIQEACFVLLHLEGSTERKKAIKELLARNAATLDEWMTRGIVGSLRIPMAWVQEAKALHAYDCGQIFEAFDLYLSAGQNNQAHEIAVTKLAPEAIIRHDLTLLTEIFSRFNGRAVDGWHVRGKILQDYAHVLSRLGKLDEELDQGRNQDERDQLGRTAARLISILPDVLRNRSDAVHNAALADMIGRLVKVVDRTRSSNATDIQPTHVGESVKLQHIQATVYARFLSSIDSP